MAERAARAPAARAASAAARAPAPEAARAPRAGAAGPTGPPVLRLVTGTRTTAQVRDATLDELLASPGPGEPLPAAVRGQLEASFRVSLDPVRVHSDVRTRGVVDRLRARAFTYGRRIFLGSRELPTDTALMAHEAAHVIQQRGRPVVQMWSSAAGASPSALEHEADRASTAVQRGEPALVMGRASGPVIQRQELGSIETGPPQQEVEDEGWLEGKIWSLLGSFADEVRKIRRIGIVAYMREHVVSAFSAVVDTLLAPVRPLLAAMNFVKTQFTTFVGWVKEAAAQIAKNDCSAITAAIGKVKDVIDGVLTTVKEKLEAAWGKVKDFFTKLWDKFFGPIWETLKEIGGAAWERIKNFATSLWDKTKPVRDFLARAWTWVKNKLGIGEGEEGQNGILQWVQKKAAEAWAAVKPIIEPYKKQLMVLAGIALLFTPAGPFVLFAAGVVAFKKAVQWFKDNAQKKNAVVEQRSFVQGTLIPAVKNAAKDTQSGLGKAVAAITDKLAGVVGGLAAVIGGLKSSVVSFVAGAVEWVQAQVQALAAWAGQQLSSVAEWLSGVVDRLLAFLQPVLDFLKQIGEIVLDILKLPAVVMGKLWKRIPACIRDPFVNFLIEQVLKKIPLFRTVTETIPAIWTRIKQAALTIIHKIFKEGDLPGALLEVLKLVLEALGIPLELFTAIFEKAGNAIDLIMADPGRFLGNVFAAVKKGFVDFGNNILTHLLGGLKDWIFGAVSAAGVTPPADFSLKAVFTFVLEVLGISLDKVFERLEKKIGREKTNQIRGVVRVLAKVWDWINTLLNEGPQGVWNRIKENLADLWGTLIGEVSNWIMIQVAKKAVAKLVQLAAAPVGTIVQGIVIIYDTLVAIKKYLLKLLQIVNSVLDMITDIAHGTIAPAASLMESLLERALGVAIGFLAQYAGLGDISERIKEIIDAIREKVDKAIDFVIDKALAVGGAVLGAIKAGAAKFVGWWRKTLKIGDHKVYAKGEEDSAEIYVESSPRRLVDFIAWIKGEPGANKAPKKKAIADVEGHIVAINGLRTKRRNESAPPKREALSDKISDEFDRLGTPLGTILEGESYGTKKNPIPLAWPGPPTANYPVMYFGGPINKKMSQKQLKKEYDKTPTGVVGGEKVKEFVPEKTSQSLPGGSGSIGIGPAYRIEIGSIVGPLSQDTTPGGGKLQSLVEPHGWNSSDDNQQLDHVREIQFGGIAKNDVVKNLWPLESRLNSIKGATLGAGSVDWPGGEKMRIADLKRVDSDETRGDPPKKFWFKVVSTR